MLIGAGVRRKGRKQVVDQVAAANILQLYLDRRASARRRGGDAADA
jgi:RNase H-fold protein (predicted Holliday junction resolvase)